MDKKQNRYTDYH